MQLWDTQPGQDRKKFCVGYIKGQEIEYRKINVKIISR
jgi:hypothetical protein